MLVVMGISRLVVRMRFGVVVMSMVMAMLGVSSWEVALFGTDSRGDCSV